VYKDRKSVCFTHSSSAGCNNNNNNNNNNNDDDNRLLARNSWVGVEPRLTRVRYGIKV
jgi:hypothetical protein